MHVIAEVPSGFFLTDALLRLDTFLEGCLLVPRADQTKAEMAGEESKKLKRLQGSLRHLFRNSASHLDNGFSGNKT